VTLELLRRLSVRGGSGKIFEYGGPGLASLLAAQRMTIANMGAELTLTTSVFPSDDVTRSFLTRLNRGGDWRPVTPDEDAEYDDQIELDLGSMGPLIALPGSPDRVVPIEEVAGTPVDQVMVGSCTNGSWHDMSSVTGVLRGRRVHSSISFVLFPGSHRILETMAREGLLADLLAAGALVSESTRRSCSSSATRSPPTTSRRPEPPCSCSARTCPPSPSTASSTSMPSSSRGRRRRGAGSSSAARSMARAPRARRRPSARCTSGFA